MSSIQRPLSGDHLQFDFAEELKRTEALPALREYGHAARTLAKDGPLRVTLVVLGPGGALDEHHATGPVTIQPLSGAIRVTTESGEQRLQAGELLVLGPGVPHGVTSADGGAFLLTVVHPPAVAPSSS